MYSTYSIQYCTVLEKKAVYNSAVDAVVRVLLYRSTILALTLEETVACTVLIITLLKLFDHHAVRSSTPCACLSLTQWNEKHADKSVFR